MSVDPSVRHLEARGEVQYPQQYIQRKSTSDESFISRFDGSQQCTHVIRSQLSAIFVDTSKPSRADKHVRLRTVPITEPRQRFKLPRKVHYDYNKFE